MKEKGNDKRLSYIAEYKNGEASISLQFVEKNSTFYNLAATENIMVLWSSILGEIPLGY